MIRVLFATLAPLALALASAPALGAGVTFEAHVSQENITLDQTVELTVSLGREGSQALDGYRAPQAPDFELLHTGTSEQMQWSSAGGRPSVRLVEQHIYVLRPRKKGALTIGPAQARIGGQELKTRPITVHVAPVPKNAYSTVAPPSPPSTTAPPRDLPAPPSELLKNADDLFVDAQLDKQRVYIGEQVTATWRLYTQSEILKYRTVTEPKHEDFWSEDLFTPAGHLGWDRQVVRGREYAVALLLKKALFPLKAGKLTVTALDAEATTLQTAFYASGSGLRRSRALTLEVLPLPAAGRPAGFEPTNVGKYQLTGSLDRTKVKAGEALTWKLVVTGTGNLHGLKLPKLDRLEGFKMYEPTSKETLEPGDEVKGEKVYAFLIMPERGGALTLPAVELWYFDPQAVRYAVSRTQPVSIAVEGDPGRLETASSSSLQENLLEPQIRPIRNRGGVRSAVGERLFRGRLALGLLVAPPSLWLLVLAGDGLRRRLVRETAGSKRRRARRMARRRLKVADYHIKAQRPSAFFAECARVLYEHLEYRLGSKMEALTLTELRAHLEGRGFSKETAEAVVHELETCDFARFAPSASGPGEMRAALRRVRTLLGWIEKVKPAAGEERAA